MILSVLLGILGGIGGYTAWYARAHSYLSDDPKACVNCHVMREQFDSWGRASHKSFATCNDCHVPHDFIGKWFTKALNGWNHSYAFTFNTYPDPIRAKQRNARIARTGCLHCHGRFVGEVSPPYAKKESLDCVRCHRRVGHGP